MPGIYVGQNMCIGSKSWEECVKQFYDEKVNFAYGFGTKTLRWTDIGHFTQVAIRFKVKNKRYQIVHKKLVLLQAICTDCQLSYRFSKHSDDI